MKMTAMIENNMTVLRALTNQEWVGMPEFDNKNSVGPYKKITVAFATEKDYNDFAKLIGQQLTSKTKSINIPHKDASKPSLLRWICGNE
jgi:hypothetical protein